MPRAATENSSSFKKEADLCAAFIADVQKGKGWKVYPETGGFDILLVREEDGAQVGVEAKLSLNVKVLDQALSGLRWQAGCNGPDYRAVLVPADKCQGGLQTLATHLGVTVITYDAVSDRRGWRYGSGRPMTFRPDLPAERSWGEERDWFEWCPVERLKLPDYVPDVGAGHSAPTILSEWKIKAIKLAIVLEERPVTRADFKALALSPTRWLDRWTGWLVSTPEGYVAGETMPDFKAHHPVNYEQIKADRDKWMPASKNHAGGLL